ncbi:hypothetical protein, partial [Enterococcus faecium]|uniref:hypothetical protein n=1 Tax=Enterococcus faecium TaxID=1352 RepID=UPI003DA053F7
SNWFETEKEEVEEVEEVIEEVKPTEEVEETKEVVTEEKPNEEVAAENVQTIIDENAVLTFLKEKGINAEKLEDLKPKEV